MKKFLSEFLYVTMLVAALCGTIYWQGHDYVQDSNNLYKQRYIEQHGAEIKTLILGHSQAAYGINPWVMGDSVFNMAEEARILYYDKEILSRNISGLPNLKVIIYPLLYQLDVGNFYSLKDFRDYSINDYLQSMGIAPPKDYNQNFLQTISFKHFKAGFITCDTLGYVYNGESIDDEKDFVIAEVDENVVIDNLRTMAKICYNHNVRMIVLTAPCSNKFNEYYVDSTGLALLNRVIDSVNINYPVEYRNYINDSLFRDNDLYHGQTHLNHKGATRFAQRIKSDFNI